jgi:sec-independent protein translocase protein TatA
MDLFSVPHLLLILLVVVVLFGAGRLPTVMGDFAKGIKAFKAGMREDEPVPPPPPPQVPPSSQTTPSQGEPIAAAPPHERV